MNQILHSDWLPMQARWRYNSYSTACSWLLTTLHMVRGFVPRQPSINRNLEHIWTDKLKWTLMFFQMECQLVVCKWCCPIQTHLMHRWLRPHSRNALFWRDSHQIQICRSTLSTYLQWGHRIFTLRKVPVT